MGRIWRRAEIGNDLRKFRQLEGPDQLRRKIVEWSIRMTYFIFTLCFSFLLLFCTSTNIVIKNNTNIQSSSFGGQQSKNRSHRAKIKVSSRLHFFLEAISLSFLASGGHPYSLVCDLFLHLQKQSYVLMSNLSDLFLCLSLLLLRILIPTIDPLR